MDFRFWRRLLHRKERWPSDDELSSLTRQAAEVIVNMEQYQKATTIALKTIAERMPDPAKTPRLLGTLTIAQYYSSGGFTFSHFDTGDFSRDFFIAVLKIIEQGREHNPNGTFQMNFSYTVYNDGK